MVFGGTYAASARAGTLQTKYLEGMSIGVAVMAFGIFGTLGTLRPGERASKAFRTCSNASFCVYLSHMFFVNILRHFGMSAAVQPALITIPAIAAAVFAASFILWLLLRRIPIVRTWLI